MELIYTDGNDKRFIQLCGELDGYLNITVGDKKQEKYDKYNKLCNIDDVVLVIDKGRAVACGSFKKYAPNVAEIKRVFVKLDYRGQGIGTKVINTLEKMAREKGFEKLILETGKGLKPAIKRYKALGFRIINNYGQYENMPGSICMEKLI